ncbi:DUF2768 domain-containing protein [Virgibacillus sp. 179-BFC.A HS]|uniref:DUF2768 domain-containing protein n=1 Tax=Tigheibacillus jepli TaxID=3035914 RepID=A0ABU5CH97_9BACI|nr:DUF2768 domain-containing protein [Virgibacillus sp. 179-BFC.A HS]MDY0405693.1 DUF2768 domain-containing protein [Virgibacillus sp. 179-BFC.A HS]
MSAAGMKELTSFIGIALLILAIVFIQLSRNKLKGWFSKMVSLLAYFCLFAGGLIVVYVVLSGPTQ